MNIQRAINYLATLGLNAPYNVMPGSFPGGSNSDFSEYSWNLYRWNPLPGLVHLPEYAEPDPEAAMKFPWQQLVWADEKGAFLDAQSDLLQSLDYIVTSYIANLYHPDGSQDRNKEWQVRLSGIDLTDKDAQRLLTIKVYDGFKSDIEAATTLEEFNGIEERINAAGLSSETG